MQQNLPANIAATPLALPPTRPIDGAPAGSSAVTTNTEQGWPVVILPSLLKLKGEVTLLFRGHFLLY